MKRKFLEKIDLWTWKSQIFVIISAGILSITVPPLFLLIIQLETNVCIMKTALNMQRSAVWPANVHTYAQL